MGGKKRIFCICLCCGRVIKHTTEGCRFVQCLDCQSKGNMGLLSLNIFKKGFNEMMLEEGKIGLFG